MATSPVKSQPFQNIPLSFFKWGNPQIHSTDHHHRSDHYPSSELPSAPIIEPTPETAAEKPWNLRPRRCSMNAAENEVTVSKSMRLRRIGEDRCVEKEKKSKRKVRLWISLSKEEVEEDVFGMTGSRPSRRPKKRSKIVQKQLDNLLPGLCLEGVSADEYRL